MKTTMRILLISDIHGNFPALRSIVDFFENPFDLVLNGGDSTVYGPFPNETINWLKNHKAISILGNTDRHVITLVEGNTFKKPRKADKRIMYGWTAAELSRENRSWLLKQPLHRTVYPFKNPSQENRLSIGMYHGSPDDPDEFLFADTPVSRLEELAGKTDHKIITVGHSHSPFYRQVGKVHFINPGSTGRMFDGNPAASCAVLKISGDQISVVLHRISYPVEEVTNELERLRFPRIYQDMYRLGRKLN